MNQPAQVSDTPTALRGYSASPERALQRCMQELVQSGVSALAHRQADDRRAGALVIRLEHLHSFLGEGASKRGHGRAATFMGQEVCARAFGAPVAAVELLRWQMRLELAELMAEMPELPHAAALLRLQLQQQLQTLARLCVVSQWTAAYFVSSGLARHWHTTQVLATFCQVQHASRALVRLEADCLWLHLNTNADQRERREQVVSAITRRAEQPFYLAFEPCAVAPAAAPAMQPQATAELDQYRQRLRPTLAGAVDAVLVPTEHLLMVLYKLAWVSEASGRDVLALAWYCAYQLCSECWFQHRALPASVRVVLVRLLDIDAVEAVNSYVQVSRNAAGAESAAASAHGSGVDTTNAGLAASASAVPSTHHCSEAAHAGVWLCQTQLLRQWPVDALDTSLPIALTASAADEPGIVSLAAVPLLLSDSFATLVSVSEDWFAAHGSYADNLAPLLRELALLEKGAAAVKVWPLEQLCTLLLDLYALTVRDCIAQPSALLTAAHADLVRLLDQAAAWRETSVNAAVVASVQQWIAQAGECKVAPGIAAPTPAEAAAAQLYQALLVYVRTLTLVVEKPVRLHVDPENAVLTQQGVLQVADALKPLLRFVLLDNTAAAWLRRAAHKPLVHTISIHVRREAGTLWIMLEEDNEGPLLTPAQTRQLQRSLPREAGPLGCEVHRGQGRWFSFTLHELTA